LKIWKIQGHFLKILWSFIPGLKHLGFLASLHVKKLENLGGLTLAVIDWNGDAPNRVNVKNLIPLSHSHLEPA
jgi:hypothetical protein